MYRAEELWICRNLQHVNLEIHTQYKQSEEEDKEKTSTLGDKPQWREN
jgi:hypothetical protein